MFSRLFYDSRFYPKKFSKTRLLIGFLLGVFSALILYSFFYLLDEAFKMIDLSFTNLPFTVSEDEKYKSNLLYAGISVIIGNSIFISYLFSRPTKALHRRSLNRRKIINEQIFLGGNFAHWFLKIGVTFGVFSSCCINFKDLVFFYPLIILMLIVLYLELWKTLLRILPKSKYKILFGHLVITVISIFALAKFNVTDYKKIEEGILKNNPVVNLPHSDYESESYNRFYFDPLISIKLKLNESNELVFYTDDRGVYNISELPNFINNERNSIREELKSMLAIRILADRNLKLIHIKDLECKLFQINIHKVYYVVEDGLKPFDEFGINSKSLSYRINPDVLKLECGKYEIAPLPFPIPPPPPINYKRFKDSTLIYVNNNVKINGVSISNNLIKKEIKNSINPKTYMKYIYDENTTYQEYINVLSAHYSVVSELRKKEQLVFDKFYSSKEYREDQWRLKLKYPILIRVEFEPKRVK